MQRSLFTVLMAMALAGCWQSSSAAPAGPPQAAIEKTIRGLFPGTDLVKNTVKFEKIQVGPARVAHTAEVYGIPGGTTYWNILAQYSVLIRNNFDPAHPSCTAQDVSQLFIAHKSDFGDWSISMVSGSENHSSGEKRVPCQ